MHCVCNKRGKLVRGLIPPWQFKPNQDTFFKIVQTPGLNIFIELDLEYEDL